MARDLALGREPDLRPLFGILGERALFQFLNQCLAKVAAGDLIAAGIELIERRAIRLLERRGALQGGFVCFRRRGYRANQQRDAAKDFQGRGHGDPSVAR